MRITVMIHGLQTINLLLIVSVGLI